MKPQTIPKLGLNQASFVAALRSGKYGQCKWSLNNGESFCALGLAAHITGCEWVPGLDTFGEARLGLIDKDGSFRSAILPEAYDKLYALNLWGSMLHELNDCGFTFPQIADAIEADPGRFFTEPR